ncbi:two-component system, response regulator YesN [Cohnella sp. OV330]|uniref:response regulator n=1 Tax=Cohnella sp. OV330 TaxID=1855288 RepID=UPI0008F0FF6E|nr:response regulator [Cohnella sp. OV330]SFB62060.1 two-component system, response regulator YesN [Cohnella sp. OV330]
MKVVIVDDERHVREAVRLLVDWETLGIREIHEAANGEEAAALIERVRPGIVVTDMMMPVRGGLDLLAWLQANNPEIQKIVISGHDDFHLVRGTMQHGGQDYLLKPIDPEQLTGALARAVARWNEQDRSRKHELARNMEINQLRPVMRDRMFSDLLGGDPYGNAQTVLLNESGAPHPSSCLVAVLDVDSASPEVADRYARHRDLLYFTLTNIADEVLRRGERGIACRNLRAESEILLFVWADPRAARPEATLEETLSAINDGCFLTLKCRFDFGIGTVQPFPQGAAISYQSARAALHERNLLAERTYHYRPEAAGARPSFAPPRLDAYEEGLRLAVLGGSDRQIGEAVGRWMAEVRRMPRISGEQLQRWRNDFGEMLRRWRETKGTRADVPGDGRARSGEADEDPAPTGVFPMDAHGRLDLDRLEAMLRDFLTAYARSRSAAGQQAQSAIPAVVRYIEQHYNKELTLQDIASRFYLSREYISRRFKQETGENLIDFLGRIRIDKAKLLLENPHFKISQVAEMVGYQDEKYFSKVFKKLTGLSPNQYRKS